MAVDEIRRYISENTGIPEILLPGDTAEAVISQARALVAYRDGEDPIVKAERIKAAKQEQKASYPKRIVRSFVNHV